MMRTLVIGYPGSGKTLLLVSLTALMEIPVVYVSLNQPPGSVTALYRRLYPPVVARVYSPETIDPDARVVVAGANPYESEDPVSEALRAASDVKKHHAFSDDCALVLDSVPPLELDPGAARRLAGLMLSRRLCRTVLVGVVGSVNTLPREIYLELSSAADIVLSTRSRESCFLLYRYKSRARGYPASFAAIYPDGSGMEVHEECPRGSPRRRSRGPRQG